MTGAQSIPPTQSRKLKVAAGASVACLAYAGSLVLQRVFPALKDLLGVSIGDGLRPTYYLRVAISLIVGAAFFVLVPRRAVSERVLAWGTVIVVMICLVCISAFP